MSLSHRPDVSDSTRARELYKYYQPTDAAPTDAVTVIQDDPESFHHIAIESDVSSTKRSSPDTALTAFSQLVAWRLGAQRALISVIDSSTQYLIAESTRTLDLVDNTLHSPGDELWVGCTLVPKAGRLCERTIALPPAKAGEYPVFIVNDLSKDARFNELPFVNGDPFLKFYAGTPLITKRGIPIGSLFILDDRVRNGLTNEEIRFLATMAKTVMTHMEMVREVEEHRRGMKMSRGLASFVEGRSELMEADIEAEDEGTMVAGQFHNENLSLKTASARASRAGSVASNVSSVDRKEKEYSTAILKTEEAIMSQSQDASSSMPPGRPDITTQTQPPSFGSVSMNVSSPPIELTGKPVTSPSSNEESESFTMKVLFSRAANLIREAFEVDGGCVFYDAQKGFSGGYSQENPGDDNSEILSETRTVESMGLAAAPMSTQEKPTAALRSEVYSRSSLISEKPVEVLGFSTPGASSIHGDELPGPQVFSTLDEKSLHTMLRRYPRGKLWTFEEDGAVSSSEDDRSRHLRASNFPSLSNATRQVKRDRIAEEAKLLLRHFPGVRQLLFVPLWDASRSRWLSGNLTWSNEPTRILSKQSELAFLTAFGNSVMAECSRMNTEIADQKKGDFIGSISHELRSPLHGILASAEFLGEELTEGFAKGLVETIDSCGRTLLDTINHILDFSKINHLEKNWRRSRHGPVLRVPNRGSGPLALRQSDIPMINLFAEVDISIVCEEVVEGVFAGHVFQNVTASSFDMVPGWGEKISKPRKYLSTESSTSGLEHQSEVAVILEIDVQNYHFTTQPGAFRRVIMNLLGNALKYTSRGYVRITLAATEMEDFHPPGTGDSIRRSRVTLTVADTGKGISSEFIRSKLFTPFAQENSLSSGTGLGLSIVKSIVGLLEGEIQIKSELGQGTEVKVVLPLLRGLPKDSSGSTPKSMSSVPKEADELIDQLRSRVIGKSASLYGFDSDVEDPILQQTGQLLKRSVVNFLSKWYGLKIVPEGEMTDIVVANEPDAALIKSLARPRRGEPRGPAILALCSHATRFNRTKSLPVASANIGYLAKPIGPLKLARVLTQILDGIPITTPSIGSGPSNTTQSSPGTTDLTSVFEELSMSPHSGEMLDNSRMAAGSVNARKALESPTPNASLEKNQEFPFPVDISRPNLQLEKPRSMPGDKESLKSLGPEYPVNRASAALTDMEKARLSRKQETTAVKPPSTPAPRLLLVDDNMINLRLLHTYMKRRNYELIDEAENGLEAVHHVHDRPDGYDIIFMDISMPVLDGFGATRQIRQLERERRDKVIKEGKTAGTPALVIALTGLASSRDQNEAFSSGIDLFLTKPVSFKEVGKMLDNWEANREREASAAESESSSTQGGHGKSTAPSES